MPSEFRLVTAALACSTVAGIAQQKAATAPISTQKLTREQFKGSLAPTR
jgi:hypothetical protein